MKTPYLKPYKILAGVLLLASTVALGACCPCWGWHDHYRDGPRDYR